ncbi:MAG: adenylyltransferase/cytidyltransferase family protein [Patescibacteria group bacterium]
MKKVFVSGCYDILHGGHIEFFSQAKALGDYLIVCFAGDASLALHKHKKSSIPEAHKKKLLESLSMVDEVVIGDYLGELGLDFKEHFLKLKPDILAVTEDDKYGAEKTALCKEIGAEYVVLPKTLNFEKISTTEIINYIKAPMEISLRVDFAGGWLDVPKFSRPGSYIINCTITPNVSLNKWGYEMGAGLGGSAAYAILTGKNGIESELDLGVGWQDPAVILESGLCVWKSGTKPELEFKVNPEFLKGKMALLWTGNNHITYNNVDRQRDFEKIVIASKIAREAINPLAPDFNKLCEAVNLSYEVQLEEGMAPLPNHNEIAKKYSGGGHGGYALYLFKNEEDRNKFLENESALAIEPSLKRWG